MCNCRQELDKLLTEKLNTEGHITDYDLISGKTHSVFKYQNGKKKKEQLILHSYCPFCGEKYGEAGGDACG